MSSKTIYFVAGEASADNHGAALMRALRNAGVDLRFIGRGGPQMKAVAGAGFQNWIDKSGVLGLWEVIKHYGYFRKQFHEALREVETSKPNAVVLIDYPGFNLRLARALSASARATADDPSHTSSVQVWPEPADQRTACWSIDPLHFSVSADLYTQRIAFSPTPESAYATAFARLRLGR
jgi:hypothetical protein